MNEFFKKFKDIEKTEQKNLEGKLEQFRKPVKVLIIAEYEWIKWNTVQALEEMSFPTNLVTFVYDEHPTSGKYDIVYGMHNHRDGVSSFDEIGKFRNLGDFLIYSDCCHGKQGDGCRADVWICDDYALTYLAWAIKDISEEEDRYLKSGRCYQEIVENALANKDLKRAKQFAKIARFEIDDVDSVYLQRNKSYLKLAKTIFNSGNKELIIDHYNFIKNKVDKLVEDEKKYNDHLKVKADERFGVPEHIELFEKSNQRPGITPQEFDINELRKSYEALTL